MGEPDAGCKVHGDDGVFGDAAAGAFVVEGRIGCEGQVGDEEEREQGRDELDGGRHCWIGVGCLAVL